ncbi:MAG: DUF4837 family protein [Bernardetiaceae bacterium]|nr:DUF4837 family protein [Bernardetiaceae bacterium]
MRILKNLSYILPLIFCIACDSGTPQTYKDLLPKAKGGRSEIMLVMDSSKWKNSLGEQVREVFRAPQEGLLQAEPIFNAQWLDPIKLNDFLKGHQALVFVLSLENSDTHGSRLIKKFFSQSSLQQIEQDTSKFMLLKTDQYAKGQNILFLFAKNDALLERHLKQNTQKIRDILLKNEYEKAHKNLYKAGIEVLLEEEIQKVQHFTVKIPKDFLIARNVIEQDTGFFFTRQVSQNMDRNFFVAHCPYVSEKQFETEALLAFRDSVAKKYMRDPDYGSYIQIQPQTEFEASRRDFTFKNQFAVELRALWRTSSLSMGGPFVAYAFTNADRSRLYYIEAFIYAPSADKRDYLREMESMMRTFTFKE